MNKLLPLACAILVAGCSFIPDYQRPAAPVPQAWPEKLGAGDTAPMGDWRAFFTDAELQKLIETALENNRDLRIAVARVDEARALAGVARAGRFPGVDVNLQQQAAKVPGDLNTTGQPLTSRRFDANLGVTAFELDFWGRVKSLDAAARASFLASEYAQQAFRLSLIADVATAYYSLIEMDARARLAGETLKSREESRRLVDKRREVGLASDLDYLAADSAYQAARADAANLARQRAAAENALRLLVGDPNLAVSMVAANPAVAVPPAPSFPAVPEIAAGLPSEVLLRRPDVLAAEQRLIAANANVGAARAAFLPKIVLTATAGTASGALSGLFAGGSGAWSFVPLLKWPLFDAGATAANEDLAVARKNIAVADYEKTVQQAFREVADLLAARRYYAEQAQALSAAAAAEGERLKRVEARQSAGVSSYLELLDAQRSSYAAEQAALAAKSALAAASSGLYKALGGN